MAGEGSTPAHTTAEQVARESYGRLLAHLAIRWRDLAAAEDALAEAFAAALEHWPRSGIPAKPESWLLTVARRKLVDAARGAALRRREDVLLQLSEAVDSPASFKEDFGDERLRLMLVCAHPAIDASVRPALILQTVLGLQVKEMAGAFLLSSETLNKRLVRAKAKIKLAALSFEDPTVEQLDSRLSILLEAIYAAYFIGREGTLVDGDANDQLGGEAVYLASVVVSLLPQNAEALGLLSLLLFCEARRPARVDAEGDFVPLLEQDAQLWDRSMLERAYELLQRASLLSTQGPFQLEAAIQAAHCYRLRAGETPWREIALLYTSLVDSFPTIGAVVGMAVAVAQAEGLPSQGIDILRRIAPHEVENYAPYWVAMSHLTQATKEEAKRHLRRALDLTTHPRLRRHLEKRLAQLG